MTKYLTDAEIGKIIAEIIDEMPVVNMAKFASLRDQAKAYNTVKAERDALYKLIMEAKAIDSTIFSDGPKMRSFKQGQDFTILKLKAQAKTIRGEG